MDERRQEGVLEHVRLRLLPPAGGLVEPRVHELAPLLGGAVARRRAHARPQPECEDSEPRPAAEHARLVHLRGGVGGVFVPVAVVGVEPHVALVRVVPSARRLAKLLPRAPIVV
eukprot:2389449-Prymnesium_polylepis.1